jgi:hypothetical protein
MIDIGQRTGNRDSVSSGSTSEPGDPQKKYPYESQYQKETLVLLIIMVLLRAVNVGFQATRNSGVRTPHPSSGMVSCAR